MIDTQSDRFMYFHCRGWRQNLLCFAVCLITLSQQYPVAEANSFSSHNEIVSTDPVEFTPHVLNGKVVAVAPIDTDLVVVGGDFTQVRDASGVTFERPYIFAFRRSTGRIVASFNPVLNRKVSSLHAGSDGASVFVGGFFTTVNGQTNRKGLTKLDLDGNQIDEFKGRTNARVKDLVLVNDVLYIAGNFSKYMSTSVDALAAVDAVTGELLPHVDFDFADPYSTTRTTGTLSVDKIDVTSDGSTLVAIGNFGTIDGQIRSRLAVFDLSGPWATLSPWTTTIYSHQCATIKPQYVTDVDISPDDSYFVVVSSGGYGGGNLACDTAHRFNFSDAGSDIQPAWTNYSGGDTYLGVAISGEAVYVGGHFRWLNNPFEAGQQGAGAIPRRGFAALDPLNGLPLSWRADRSPRGVGTYEVLVDDHGVWVGDDTDNMSFEYHPRLKYLPLADLGAVSRPSKPQLPTTVYHVRGSSLTATPFDGSNFGTPVNLTGSNWGDARGMLFLGGAIFYGSTDGMFYANSINNGNLGNRKDIALNGLSDIDFPLANIGGMYFDYDQGRIYYTVRGDNTRYYRYFTPESFAVGAMTFTAPDSFVIPWAEVRGMDRIGNHLYYSLVDGGLYRVNVVDNVPVAGTTVLLSAPAIDGRDWSDGVLAFQSEDQIINPTPDRAEFEFSSSGSASSGSWQVFSFSVDPGEAIDVELRWDNPDAALNVFLRDPQRNAVVSDTSQGGSPKWLSSTASFGGTWSVGVKIKDGATDFDVLVNPLEPATAPQAEHEFASSGCNDANSFQTFSFPVSIGDTVQLALEWSEPLADVNIFLRDESGGHVSGDSSFSGSPKSLTTIAASSGNWSAAVKIKQGCTDFKVLVDADGGTDAPAPIPVSHWSLDGDYLDSIGSNHGTSVVGPMFEYFDEDCHYALFNGTPNQFIEIPFTPDLNTGSFTVSFWVRSDGGTSTHSMVASRWETPDRSDLRGWAAYENSLDRWIWITGEGSREHTQPGPNLLEGIWTHVAFTFDQTGLLADGTLTGKKRMYVNGTLVNQRNGGLKLNDTGPMTIGSRSTAGRIGNANRYIGGIDELQVFNQALDGTDINRVRIAHPGCSGL